MPKVTEDGQVSNLKNYSGYSVSVASLMAAILIAFDRYAELAGGAESFSSWAIPPMFLFSLAVTALIAVRLGHPDEGETHA